jgi:hypothetical protein
MTPAQIAGRISDGTLRLPEPPAGAANEVLPRWSDYAGDFKDPGPDDLVLQQALDEAVKMISNLNVVRSTLVESMNSNDSARLGAVSNDSKMVASPTFPRWFNANKALSFDKSTELLPAAPERRKYKKSRQVNHEQKAATGASEATSGSLKTHDA